MQDNFFTKCYCELVITSPEIEIDYITRLLNIVPSRFFKKGEKSISKHSQSIITRPYNLWAITTKNDVLKNSLSDHLLHLKLLLKDKLEVLHSLKNSNIEIGLWIWIETEDAGIGLDLLEEDLSFFQILNRIHFSLITNKTVSENFSV